MPLELRLVIHKRFSFWWIILIIGFLWAGDSIIQANIGLRDQLFAFNWLFRNIAAFGGDPYGMTMAGHGSGAASICYHSLSRVARGKWRIYTNSLDWFYNCIICDGNILHFWTKILNIFF